MIPWDRARTVGRNDVFHVAWDRLEELIQVGKTLALYKKGPGCLYFLKRIRFFAICWATVAQQTDCGN